MSWKYKLIERYIIERNRLSKGLSLIYDFKTIIMIWLMAEIYIKMIYDVPLTMTTRIIGGVILVVGFWLVGLIWDTQGFYIIEAEWGNKRNQLFIDMRKKFNLPKEGKYENFKD